MCWTVPSFLMIGASTAPYCRQRRTFSGDGRGFRLRLPPALCHTSMRAECRALGRVDLNTLCERERSHPVCCSRVQGPAAFTMERGRSSGSRVESRSSRSARWCGRSSLSYFPTSCENHGHTSPGYRPAYHGPLLRLAAVGAAATRPPVAPGRPAFLAASCGAVCYRVGLVHGLPVATFSPWPDRDPVLVIRPGRPGTRAL